MKIVRNESYIRKRSQIARYASLGGLAALLVTMVTWFPAQQNPQLLTISFAGLLIGFILAQVGIYYGNRFARADRPEEVLNKSLKGLDDRYILYHYVWPTPHVLLGPDACYVMNVYWQSGRITARGDRWKQSLGWRRLLLWFGQESIGNPVKAAQLEIRSLQSYLAKKLPDVRVTLTPVIVFGSPDVELDVADVSVPVVHAKKLKEWLRSSDREQKLLPAARAELIKLFGSDR